MKPSEQQIREATHAIWYAHPSGVSTFSVCPCGQGPARGGRMCDKCAEEALAKLVGPTHAADYHKAVKHIRQLESEMVS